MNLFGRSRIPVTQTVMSRLVLQKLTWNIVGTDGSEGNTRSVPVDTTILQHNWEKNYLLKKLGEKQRLLRQFFRHLHSVGGNYEEYKCQIEEKIWLIHGCSMLIVFLIVLLIVQYQMTVQT